MFVPAYLWVYVAWGVAVMAFVVLTGLAVALNIFGYPSQAENRRFTWAVMLVVGWVGVCTALGLADSSAGVFALPGVRVAISGVVGLRVALTLLKTSTGAAIVRAVPQSWLVGVQAYRGLGSMFLILSGAGLIPRAFGLPAGFGDVGIGLVAVPLAAFYARQPWSAWRAVAAWNILGLADLMMAVTLAVLTAPALHLLPGPPNYLLTLWPLNMIALFAVPLSAVLHVVSLTKLAWDRQTLTRRPGQGVAANAAG